MQDELHHEGGPGDQCVPERDVGADEDPLRVPGNHRRAQTLPSRVSRGVTAAEGSPASVWGRGKGSTGGGWGGRASVLQAAANPLAV